MIVDITPTHSRASSDPVAPVCTLDFSQVVSQIATLEAALFTSGAWNEAMIRQEMQAPMRTYIADVYTQGEQTLIRGYAGYFFDGYDAQIMTIAVAQDYQHQGIGASLLACLLESAKKLHAERMLLEVRVDNDPALRLYKRFGFSTMGLRKRYYQPEGVDAYTMSCDLRNNKQWARLEGEE